MFTLTADGHVTLTMPDGMVVEEMWDSEDDVVRGIGFNHGMGEARLDPFESDIVEIAWNTMSTGSQQALRVRYDFRLKEPGPVYIRWKEDTRLSWGRINMGEDPARQDGTRIPLVLLDMVGTWPLHRTVVLSPIADRPYQPSQEVPITINNDGTVVFDGIVFDLVGFFAKDGNSLNLQMSSSANQVGKIVIIIDTDYKPRFQIDRLELHAAGLVQFKAALK